MSEIIGARDFRLTGSLFEGFYDTQPKPFIGTALELFGERHQDLFEKDKGRMFCPATFKPGATKCNDGVSSMGPVLSLDADKKTKAQIDLLRVTFAGHCHVFHTTFQHGLDGHRVRLHLFLSRPMTIEEFRYVRYAVVRSLPIATDPVPSALSTGFLLPAHPPRPFAPPELSYNEGRLLDVDRAIESAKKIWARNGGSYGPGRHDTVKKKGTVDDMRAVARAGCAAYADVLERLFAKDTKLGHFERIKIVQLAAAVGMTVPQIVELFRHRTDFDPHVCEQQVLSLFSEVKRPGCAGMAESGLCNGRCPAISRTRSRSPLGLVAWELEGLEGRHG